MSHEAAKLDTDAVEKYLSGVIPGFQGPIEAEKTPTGQSNPTFLLSWPNRRFVLRKKPPGVLLKSAHQVEREYRVMKALRRCLAGLPRLRHRNRQTECRGARARCAASAVA